MALRPSLPASSSDFALHQSTPAPSTEDFNPLLMRFRRPSLLAPPRATFYDEGRLQSPLAGSSFTIPLSRRYTASSTSGEESESDKEKMWTDSPPSVNSGSATPATPALAAPIDFTTKDKSTTSVDSDSSMKSSKSDSSSGPVIASTVKGKRPRSSPSPSRPVASIGHESQIETTPQTKARRISQPHVKLPRIASLLAESRPEDNEVKSEAQFQRFISSFSTQPRTPRAVRDRGRFPEEVGDEPTGEDSPSEDEDEAPFFYSGGSEPINIAKPITPAQSVYGDDTGLSESPGNMAMDIDMPSSACGSPKLASNSWRYTPPPTSTSAVRSNKRKVDDRYDPYPSAKRRAVSPSVSYLREAQPSLFCHTPRTPGSNGRVSISLPHPIAIPVIPSSGASSPIVTPSTLNNTRPISWGAQGVMSSPTLRAQIGLASPVLRPIMRRREEGKEVDGAGEAVNGLSLEEHS